MPQEPASQRPGESKSDSVDQFINEQKSMEAKRQELIKDLLRQKEAAIKAFDDKLAKLGHRAERTSRRSHHKTADKKSE